MTTSTSKPFPDLGILPGSLDLMTDAELNGLFAVAYAGWRNTGLIRGDKHSNVVARWTHDEIKRPGSQAHTPRVLKFKDGGYGGDLWPTYCTDANAVLPYLEKLSWDSCYTEGQSIHGNYMVRSNGHIARGNSFARAAVIALLRAQASP